MSENLITQLAIDFRTGRYQQRQHYGGGKSQAIAKAVGVKKTPYPTVIDATTGLGVDSWVLASLGCQVTMIEQHPTILAALQTALTQALADEKTHTTAQRLHLVTNNALTIIPTLPTAEVIYLDPMFPARTKSALVKQPMRTLQQLVDEDETGDALLQCALQYAGKRVVVKRPAHAPVLGNTKPSYQLKGKSNRFDVYLTQKEF